MPRAALNSMLISSRDPKRLGAWYAEAFGPEEDNEMDGYRMMKFGEFMLVIDTRDDIGDRNPEPGRMILNFDTDDAQALVERLDRAGVEWLAPIEDRGDGDLFATAIDPDGNYVQVIQISEESRRAMESGTLEAGSMRPRGEG
ncbi:MAG: VOC family protein [Candidatus Limnocylindria bacterium]